MSSATPVERATPLNEQVVKLTVDEAISRLAIVPDYDPGGTEGPGPCVHTFRDAAFGLIGAHWRVGEARTLMEKFGVEESGPQAMAMSHGVVVVDKAGSVFFETRSAPAPRVDGGVKP